MGISSIVVTWGTPTAVDNSGQTPQVQPSHTSGASFTVGTTTVTYAFVDLSGNRNTCQFDVTVTPSKSTGEAS